MRDHFPTSIEFSFQSWSSKDDPGPRRCGQKCFYEHSTTFPHTYATHRIILVYYMHIIWKLWVIQLYNSSIY